MSGPVRRADRLIRPRGAKRTLLASLSAAAPAHLWDQSALSGAWSAEREAGQVRFCSPVNSQPPDAGTQFCEVYLSAQPVGDFQVCMAVRTGRSFVWMSWPPAGQLIPKRLFSSTVHGAFSFPQEEKRMGGASCTAKPCFSAPCIRAFFHAFVTKHPQCYSYITNRLPLLHFLSCNVILTSQNRRTTLTVPVQIPGRLATICRSGRETEAVCFVNSNSRKGKFTRRKYP